MKVWDLSSGKECLFLVGHIGKVNDVAMSTNGRWIFIASEKKVKAWDLAKLQKSHTLPRLVKPFRLGSVTPDLLLMGHTQPITRVVMSPNEHWVLSASWDHTVKVWNWATGQERLTFTGHTRKVAGVTVSADGRWVLSCSFDHTLKVWQLADGQVLASFDAGERLTCCAFAEDGRTIVAGGASGRVHVLRLEGVDEL